MKNGAGIEKKAFLARNSMGKGVEGRESLIVVGRARMLLGLEHGR